MSKRGVSKCRSVEEECQSFEEEKLSKRTVELLNVELSKRSECGTVEP